ncbi:tryptophan halogenase family protein [Aliikangiella sp. G2MR2-5]|uniref:tryptophan halogenase family protein n=1 Tax=Aliikangiella sp. G2MR2-5 TaxID=2788943 RepID=UPI0018AA12CB|nr:tryptophan halogenase family protein [Aliikangiella sp. G2MR2-5]
MRSQAIKKVVIVGGGTAGWITASLLAKVLGKVIDITLIESSKIGTIGVGEATIPPIIAFNNALGINEKEFIRATQATIKLGIQFENWGRMGDSYMHAFGDIGKNFPFCEFHHFWVKTRRMGMQSDFWDFSLNFQAAKQNKFQAIAGIKGTNLPGIQYAYHFDASLYAKFLSEYSRSSGVELIDGIVEKVNLNSEDGFVDSIQVDSGETIAGDLFIDCTGLKSLLIEQTLNTGFDDWSHWLPCNRAVAVQSENGKFLSPYTRSIAHEAGWQWQIPLQHRTGNGLVFSDMHLSDEQAIEKLLANIEGQTLTDPKVIPYRTGKRRKQWNRNVIAIGLSAGFFEPLESTNIHLIQTAAIRLLKLFPHNGITESEVTEYNQQTQSEYERIRDFVILHYKQTERNDSDFWRQCHRMDVPESLSQRMALFKSTGKVFRTQDELFTEVAWKQVLIGQGAIPEDYHPMADTLSEQQLKDLLSSLKTLIGRTVEAMPTHESFLDSLQ